MTLYKEILKNLGTVVEGLRPINAAGDYELCYTYNSVNEIGVAIPNPKNKVVDQAFNHARLVSKSIQLPNDDFVNYLFLNTTLTSHVKEFALIASEFVSPLNEYELRHSIQNDPHAWWNRWQELIGNSKIDINPQFLIAELVSFKEVFLKDESAVLKSYVRGTHDIQAELCNYEVKSTVSRFDNIVTISSQFQLDNSKPLNLIFVKMEKEIGAVSINSAIESLNEIGYNTSELEVYLRENGLYKGAPKRDESFKILEIRKYIVDDSFPKIVLTDEQKEHILKVTYSVNLNGISFEKL